MYVHTLILHYSARDQPSHAPVQDASGTFMYVRMHNKLDPRTAISTQFIDSLFKINPH